MKKDILKKSVKDSNKQRLQFINVFFSKYFKLIMILIMAVFLLLGYQYVIKPKRLKIIEGAQQAISVKEDEQVSLERYFGKLEKYKRSFDSVSQQNKTKMSVMIPKASRVPELYREMEALIAKTGLLLTKIDIAEAGGTKKAIKKGQTAPEEPATPVEIAKYRNILSIVGTDYNNFKKLLVAMENSLHIMDVQKVNFDPKAKTTFLELNTYYLK